MANFNKVILMGFVGKDPQIKNVSDSVKVANIDLAVTESGYTTASGQVPDRTTWFTLVAWRGLADVVEKYVKKGSNIHVDGKIRINEYTDKDGNKKSRIEVEVVDLQLLDRKI